MPYTYNAGTTYVKPNYNSSQTDRDSISAANRDANNRSQDLDAMDRAADRADSRTVNTANRLDKSIGNTAFLRQQEANREEREFKSSESRNQRSQENEQFNKKIRQEELERSTKASQTEADRDKAKSEFDRNSNRDLLRLQVQGNKEKGDAALELTKAYRDRGFQESSERNSAQNQQILANINNAAQQKLADTAQQTALGEQSASIKRAQENAKAQVSAALYGSSRQYAGY